MGGLGETMDENFGKKKNLILKKLICFLDSNPGKIDDFHEMR